MVMSGPLIDPCQFDFSEMPEADSIIPTNCPVPTSAAQALQASKKTRQSLQDLRENLIGCADCTAFERCKLSEHFNQLVDRAIAEISEEWGW
jgi:hypothetical protein